MRSWGDNRNCTQEGAFLLFILSPEFTVGFGPIKPHNNTVNSTSKQVEKVKLKI